MTNEQLSVDADFIYSDSADASKCADCPGTCFRLCGLVSVGGAYGCTILKTPTTSVYSCDAIHIRLGLPFAFYHPFYLLIIKRSTITTSSKHIVMFDFLRHTNTLTYVLISKTFS